MIFIDYLNNEERNFLNKVAEGKTTDEITRKTVISELKLTKSLCAVFETILENLIEKISNASEEEWEHLIRCFPLQVDYSFEDGDVPTAEELEII